MLLFHDLTLYFHMLYIESKHFASNCCWLINVFTNWWKDIIHYLTIFTLTLSKLILGRKVMDVHRERCNTFVTYQCVMLFLKQKVTRNWKWYATKAYPLQRRTHFNICWILTTCILTDNGFLASPSSQNGLWCLGNWTAKCLWRIHAISYVSSI